MPGSFRPIYEGDEMVMGSWDGVCVEKEKKKEMAFCIAG